MITYKQSGVDIDKANELVKRIKQLAPGIGDFSGCFEFGDQLILATTDGVGTKLKIAFMAGVHHTVGIDLVAMCVNDLICAGAKPLFFLDYFATGKLELEVATQVVSGIAGGCEQAGCVLLGGETAEMPDFYAEGEYDLAGFAVGVVDKQKLINGKDIAAGDALVGLYSSGLHSNGFSLVRKLLFKEHHFSLEQSIAELGTTLGQELLKPTSIYVKTVLNLMAKHQIKGIAHITGGGFHENLPRILPKGLGATIKKVWNIPPIFTFLQRLGQLDEKEMFRTFNMGIGMVLITSPRDAQKIVEETDALIIGEVAAEQGVCIQKQ